MIATPTSPRLIDLPLWRLVVALHDAEDMAGPDSESAQLIRQAIIKRLSGRTSGNTTIPEEPHGH